MKTTLIKSLYRETEKHLNTSVQITGWIRTLRNSKAFGFIEVNDGSFFKNVQIVFEDTLPNFKEISKLPICSSLSIVGKVVETPGTKQPFEIHAESIEVVGLSNADYPLQKKRHSLEYLRTIAHLRPRSNTFSAVFRVRSLVSHAIHQFFFERGFVYVHTPIITGSDCEGAGEMFRVTTLPLNDLPKTEDGTVDCSQDFFGKETNLTVSGQLNGEIFALSHRNIYTFGPTFRAENSNTRIHANEFWMIEPEMAFADLKDDMAVAEDLVKFVIKFVMEHAPEEMDFFNSFVDKTLKERLTNVLESDFGVITYTEAVEKLKNSGVDFEFPVEWGCDLQTEHEKYLSGEVFGRPVFITDYPKDIKAFYMRMNDDNKTVAAMDLLVPGVGELVGGSQREERLDMLEKRLEEMNLSKEDYWWYLELRKYGGTVHSGFGIGFERLLMFITGMENIRDVIPFPRTPKNAEF